MVSPVHPVTAGASVSLSCREAKTHFLMFFSIIMVNFYKMAAELSWTSQQCLCQMKASISVNIQDTFQNRSRCQLKVRRNFLLVYYKSYFIHMNIFKAAKSVSESFLFLVLLEIVPVGGTILIILLILLCLILLCHYKQPKGQNFFF